MRFKQYIINEDKIDNEAALSYIKDIEKNCKPFLKAMKSNNFKEGNLLFSGRSNNVEDFIEKSVRGDRKPLDTPPEIHE
jgi:hypothetical protein